MIVVHLTASTLYGGPERQMLGLARHLPETERTVLLSFSEGGRCRPFLAEARRQGCEAHALENDTPHFRAAVRELTERLTRLKANVLLCHGYKANLLGRPAARACGIPAVAVSRGWTAESFRVRLYERLDRFLLRWMDRVVCVSEAQAQKVRRAGVRGERVRVIHNAIDPDRFADPDPLYRSKLARYFRGPKALVVGAAGRLSPEKGFDVLVAAARRVLRGQPSVGFVLFGDGPCRTELLHKVNAAGLAGSFVLAGFRADLDRFLSQLDLFVLPSHTEGLPNVVLEACAAGTPVVATSVGGTPEVIEDGLSGLLAPPGDPEALAGQVLEALVSEERLRELGFQGRQRVLEHFSFRAQVARYRELFEELCGAGRPTPQPANDPPAEQPAPDPSELVPVEPSCER